MVYSVEVADRVEKTPSAEESGYSGEERSYKKIGFGIDLI